jgi:N-acetylglucosamine-6-phosphate deacetylase
MQELFFGKAYVDETWVKNCIIRLQAGVIKEIIPDMQCPENALDYSDCICSPGFIDMHIHGAFGKDTMDGEVESLQVMADFITSHGTTSFLPTTMTANPLDVLRSLDAIDRFMNTTHSGANCLGTHLEGPFINPGAKGAQSEKFIQSLSVAGFKSLVGTHLALVKTITLAPEEEGAEELIRYLTTQQIVPVIGHTMATYEQARESFKWGVRHTTHLFNAMTGLHHRKPGVVGACLEDNAVTVELICDLIHVHPAAIRIVIACKGPQNVAMITDAMSAAGLGAGKYQLGGQDVWMKDGEARLADGTLAGSVLTQDVALQNLAGQGIPLETILEMISATPARILGVSDHKGHIRVGADADLTVLSKDLQVRVVFVAGKQQ